MVHLALLDCTNYRATLVGVGNHKLLNQPEPTILQGSYKLLKWFHIRNLQNSGFWLVKVRSLLAGGCSRGVGDLVTRHTRYFP